MKRLFLLLLLMTAAVMSFAQDFSNKGKDFWLGYGYHVRYVTNGNNGVNGQEMVLYFATENIPNKLTDIRIEIPALGYVENISNVAPGTIVFSSPLPKSGGQDARLTGEGLFNSGIHVTSSRPVVAYAHIFNGNVSGATLLFPTNTLGKEYYSMNYTQVSNEASSNCFFFVVATDTGSTTVEITPSAQTLSHAAGVPFTVTLNQGEIYNVMGALTGGNQGNFTGADLTGSKIQSITNGGIGCKKIAVFSGSGKIKISCNANSNSSDNLFAQAFPKTAWGKKFLTVPTQRMPNNYYRIGVSSPSTVVKVNGVVQSALNGNFYYDLPLSNQPQVIEGDQPIMVAQYITTANTCGNNAIGGNGDPEMIYLSPIEQTIDEVILYSTTNAAISEHWVNVIIKSAAVPSFSITGALGTYSFLTHPRDASYSYAQIRVNAGSHTLSADSGFNAIAYGYGNAESYGYNAGTNLKDLYNFIEPINPLNVSGTLAACNCTPFYLAVTYPFQPLSLFWDFKGSQTPNVTINNPVADSTYFINGKQVWRYKLPSAYSYCTPGNYAIAITAGSAGTEGCGNVQVKEDTLKVRNAPPPDFNWVHNGCVNDSVRFNDATVYEENSYSYKWKWDFGDGNTSTGHNPAHKYNTPGAYTVSYSLVTDIGCESSIITRQIKVTAAPVANFGISNALCINKTILFSDSSTVPTPGIIQTWYWDFGDGTKDTSLTNVSRQHSYTSVGQQNVTLQVATPSGCLSAPISKPVLVNPNPVVNFNLPSKVCLPYGLATFTDASSISDHSEAGFSFRWRFGEPSSGANDSAAIKNPSHLYSSAAPFNVTLIVQSAAGCIDSTTKILATVYAQPHADFTVNPENCLNTATGFSSSSNGQGNTITGWNWDFADLSTGSGQTTTHTYAAASSYQVKHWVLTDKGCYSDTATKLVTVNPLPVANFTIGAPACEKNNVSITDASVAGAGAISAWTWNFGNGRPDSVINNNLPFNYRYDTAKNYTVSLSLLTDKGCKTASLFSKAVVVNPLPKPGFISPEVCLTDASAQFVDTSSIAAGSISNWVWNFGDPGSGVNNSFTGQSGQHRYSATGFYTAVLTVTSAAGCRDSVAQTFTVNGDVPKANFNVLAAATVCANDSVAVKDSSSVDFGSVTRVEIYWDIVNAPLQKQVDDLPVFGKEYRHLYPDFQTPLTKDYFVRYKSYSGTSCVDSITKKITVHAAPKVSFSAVTPLCLDAVSYQVTQASEGGTVPGTGLFTGQGISGGGLFTPSVTGAGTFSILYTYTSPFGCVDTISNTITVLNPAIANFGFSKPTCEKNSIVITDSSSIPAASGTIVNRTWDFGDGTAPVSSSTNAPVTHTYSVQNTYTITLTLTSSSGCKVSKQKQVKVNPLPVPAFSFPASACLPNASITFTDASSIADGTQNAFTYSWRFGDPASSSNTSVSKNPAHVFSTAGPYAVTLVCTSGAGCKDSVTLSVNTIHPQPTAAFSSDSTSICEQQSVRFSDASTGADGTVNKWSWDFGNGSFSSLQVPPSQTYTAAGRYSIALQVENSLGCKDTAIKPFTVYANPVISAGPNKVLLEGGEISLEGSASGTGLHFLWTADQRGNYLNNNQLLQPVLKGITDDITYKLLVVAAGGCWKEDTVFIKLLKAPVIPNTISPNADGVNDNWTILYLDSYPDCKIQVFNRDGQPVFESYGYKNPGWNGRYNGKPVPFGTYYYVIQPGSGRKPITGYITVVY